MLQQRNVSGLQQAIKPRLPSVPPRLAEINDLPKQTISSSRLFRGSSGEAHLAQTDFQKIRSDSAAGQVDWQRLAHVQIVRHHRDVCNAIMVLADLHRLQSPARRILLFPQAWALEKKSHKGDVYDPFIDSSRRLIKLAARRYGVELRPITPLAGPSDGAEGNLEVYSLASAFALTEFDRVLSIEAPGIVLEALPLDSLLAFTEPAPFALLQDTDAADELHAQDLHLLQPSLEIQQTLRTQLSQQSAFDDARLPEFFPGHLLLSPGSDRHSLIQSIGLLHDVDSSFNATAFLQQTAYLRFSDPKLPGPEFDVPFSMRVDARPRNTDADWTWTKMYGLFGQRRVEVCGLDLETWRP